jgi:hypothetical protein
LLVESSFYKPGLGRKKPRGRRIVEGSGAVKREFLGVESISPIGRIGPMDL